MSKSRSPISAKHCITSRSWRHLCLAGLSAAAAVGGPAITFAGVYYWTGDNDANWNTTSGLAGTNWSSSPDFNNGTAGLPGLTDNVNFVLFGAQNLSTSLGQDFSINSLSFTSDAIAANPIAIGGSSTLTLGAGGLTNNSNAPITLSTKVALGAAQIWTNNSTAQPLAVSGVISGATANGLTLTGSGSFNFSGANTYSGATTLSISGTSLTLSGANGSLLNTAALTLNGGSTLTLDSSGANQASQNRLADTLGVSMSGATLNLVGDAAAPTTETIGTVTLNSGASVISATGTGAVLTLGSASLASLARPFVATTGSVAAHAGSTVNFSIGSGAAINLPNVTLSNGLIGGWATVGKLDNSGALDFATVDVNGNVVPYAAYATALGGGAATNVQLNSTVTGSSQTINSLSLTGAGNINFAASGQTITIAGGGIISNGATSTVAGANNQPALPNCASIGIIGASSTGSLTSSGPDLVITTASNLQIFSTISGAIGLTKSGVGILDLSQQNSATRKVNTYTGITTINGGVVKVDADSNLGTAPSTFEANDITLNGGDLRTSSGFGFNANRGITVGPQGGTLSYVGGSKWTIAQPITGAGGMTFFADPANNTNNTSNVPFVILSNTGTPNNYAGPTVLMASANTLTVPAGSAGYGVVQFGAANQIPAGSAVTVTAVGQDLDGDAGVVDLQGTIQTFGSLAGNMNIMGLTGTLTVGANNGSTTYSGVLGFGGPSHLPVAGSGTLSGSAATGNLVKVGTGTFTLSGSNLYTGSTSIGTASAAGGTLLVGSGVTVTSSASLGGAAVTVGNGANSGSLGGNGTINGPVTVTSSGHLAPAMSAVTTNTLTIANNLTLNDGSTLDFNFGAAPAAISAGALGTSDQVLETAGFAASLNGNITLNITPVSTSFGIGAYDLIDCSASAASFSNAATFNVNGSTNFNYAVVAGGSLLDASVGGGVVPAGDIYLEVLQGNPSFSWVGNHDGNWNTTTANWTSIAAGSLYSNGSNVTFDDTATGTNTITVAAAGVSPNSIAFNNGSHNYVFGGGDIDVTSGTGIVKNQAGSVTFNNNVTTTLAEITAGSLVVGDNGTFTATKINIDGGSFVVNGSVSTPTLNDNLNGSLTVGSNGSLNSNIALAVNGPATFNNSFQYVGAISGSGTITLNGTTLAFFSDNTFGGTLTGAGGVEIDGGNVMLSNGANNYSGPTQVNTGKLLLANTSGSATGTGAISVQSGAFLDGSGSASGTVLIASGGQLQGTGSYSGTVNISGTLSPAGDGQIGKLNLGTVSLNSGAALNYDLSGSGGNDTAAVAGALTLAGAETLNLNLLPGVTVGDYPLFTAAGAITDGATFTINASGAGAAPGVSYSVLTVGNQLILRLSVPTLVWTGATSNNWDFVDANWTANPYSDVSAVSFTDSGANTTISVNAAVAPFGGLMFSNSVMNYTLTGQPIGGGGGVTLNGTGSVTLGAGNTFTGATVINSGTLSIAADSSIGAAPAAATPAFLTIAAGGTLAVTPGSSSFTLSQNRGMAIGGAAGSGATLDVPTGVVLTYNGIITDLPGQQGILNKTDVGELDLGGANTFSGGLDVTAGAVKLTNPTAAGAGPISVGNAGSILNVGANIANPTVTLGGGAILGVAGGAQTISGNLVVSGATAVDAFDAVANAAPNDLILTGMLLGSGNLTVGNANGASPDNAGFRLRGPASTGPSAFSGTITVLPSSKFEIQTAAASGDPAGAATIVMQVGATSSAATGAFSLVDLRNNSAGNTSLPNNYQLTGANGAAVFNLLGTAPAGSSVSLGSLQIGDTQSLETVSTVTTAPYTASFSSVLLTGGNATFTPQPVGNTIYVGAENVSLGPITESAPHSGLTMNGAATLTLAAANSYTGSTIVQSGSVVLGAAGALPAASALVVNGGSVDLNNGVAGNDQTVAALSGADGLITNSDAVNPHTFVVNQSSSVGPTSFAGSISGNLNLTKSGSGTLQLLGSETYTGTTTVSGGTLVVQGALSGSALVNGSGTLNVGSTAVPGTLGGLVTVGSGGTLAGVGSTQAVTVQAGGTLAPGNSTGSISVNGALDLSAPGSQLVLRLGGTSVSPTPSYGNVVVTGPSISLGGDVTLSFLGGGYQPAVGDTFYAIVDVNGSPVSGTFSNAPVSGSVSTTLGSYTDPAGDTFAVSYTADFSNPNNASTNGAAGFAPGQGDDIAFQVLSAVPEPGSLPALATGLCTLLAFRRPRRSSIRNR